MSYGGKCVDLHAIFVNRTDTNDKKNKYSYSTKSFLGRKLMIFFDDVQKQSKEFGKLKEDLKLTNELINLINNNKN